MSEISYARSVPFAAFARTTVPVSRQRPQHSPTGRSNLIADTRTTGGHHQDQITWLTTNESAITELIDRFNETGHHERIWRDWNPGERTIRVLRDAIRNAPDEVTTLGAFHSAKELFEAVEAYDPETDWKRDVCNRISSPRSLGNLLVSQRDHRSLTIRQHGNTNHYRIQKSSRGVQPLEVETIEDLFKLPCMTNMDDRLNKKKPVRKDSTTLLGW